ncbi:MAG: hypothetical protein LBS50_03050 [Prevotellaceae bacterium]|jgi:hypothetical protein|nr:hypothetical protein [Prevotellaceae bacterium]
MAKKTVRKKSKKKPAKKKKSAVKFDKSLIFATILGIALAAGLIIFMIFEK